MRTIASTAYFSVAGPLFNHLRLERLTGRSYFPGQKLLDRPHFLVLFLVSLITAPFPGTASFLRL